MTDSYDNLHLQNFNGRDMSITFGTRVFCLSCQYALQHHRFLSICLWSPWLKEYRCRILGTLWYGRWSWWILQCDLMVGTSIRVRLKIHLIKRRTRRKPNDCPYSTTLCIVYHYSTRCGIEQRNTSRDVVFEMWKKVIFWLHRWSVFQMPQKEHECRCLNISYVLKYETLLKFSSNNK